MIWLLALAALFAASSSSSTPARSPSSTTPAPGDGCEILFRLDVDGRTADVCKLGELYVSRDGGGRELGLRRSDVVGAIREINAALHLTEAHQLKIVSVRDDAIASFELTPTATTWTVSKGPMVWSGVAASLLGALGDAMRAAGITL